MADIAHPKLQRLYQYWTEKRCARSMPARADIDPLEMRFVVGNVILIDVIAGTPPSFRIRLHGTRLAEHAGYELTGKMLDDMPEEEFRNLWRASGNEVVGTKQPLHAQRDRILDGRLRRYEVIILPLSSNDNDVDMILCGLIHDDERD